MAQLQTLILKDRETVPVDHTFTPRNISQGVGEVVESSGVPIGESRFTISLRKTQANRYKSTIKLIVPVTENETINGISVPRVVRTSYVSLEVDFAGSSTTAERNNVIGMLQDALGSDKVLVNSTLVDLEGIY